MFAKPWEEDQPFPQFLQHVIQQEMNLSSHTPDTEVRYAQTRKLPN